MLNEPDLFPSFVSSFRQFLLENRIGIDVRIFLDANNTFLVSSSV